METLLQKTAKTGEQQEKVSGIRLLTSCVFKHVCIFEVNFPNFYDTVDNLNHCFLVPSIRAVTVFKNNPS
jgi:hypothetical protein